MTHLRNSSELCSGAKTEMKRERDDGKYRRAAECETINRAAPRTLYIAAIFFLLLSFLYSFPYPETSLASTRMLIYMHALLWYYKRVHVMKIADSSSWLYEQKRLLKEIKAACARIGCNFEHCNTLANAAAMHTHIPTRARAYTVYAAYRSTSWLPIFCRFSIDERAG